jgi:hypothetical protein
VTRKRQPKKARKCAFGVARFFEVRIDVMSFCGYAETTLCEGRPSTGSYHTRDFRSPTARG